MRIALAQINPILGDFSGNKDKILAHIKLAKEQSCELIVFPEMALFGYHPMDLLERKSIVAEQIKQFNNLEKEIPRGISALVGVVQINSKKAGKPFFNSAALVTHGKKTKFFAKTLLPAYDVFDETRHFEVGNPQKNILNLMGKKILVTICEDIWAWPDKKNKSPYQHNPLKDVKTKVDLIINLSASPFTIDKISLRKYMIEKTAQHFRAPLIYVNLIGAQDELIFDGGSRVVNAQGKLLLEGSFFTEDFSVYDLGKKNIPIHPAKKDRTDKIKDALVLGIRDYVAKIGFKRIHLGLSGGIDSAIVACLASEAIGSENVTCIGLPGPFNSPQSLETAKTLAHNLNTQWLVAPISETYEGVLSTLKDLYDIKEFGLVNENLQARLRGLFLMVYANRYNSLLLTTGNKSEYATGYATLYGDMCGGLAPIGDLLKKQVYDLARYFNREKEIIPNWIIDRPPSAELRPNQKDEDSLPPYDQLDNAVQKLVEEYRKPSNETERWVLKSLMMSEFKRWQAPPILKVSTHAFGRGRRLPVAHKAWI